jgi:DNA invertase Pin-like site-specific DNA recombinase
VISFAGGQLPPKPQPRTFVYFRESTDKQTNDRQQHNIDQLLAKYPQLNPVHEYVRDHAVSGKYPFEDRPGGKHLLRQFRPGDRLVIDRLDRLSRKLADGLYMCSHLCTKLDVEIWASQEALKLPLDGKSAVGQLQLAMLLFVAQMQREKIAETTLEAMRARKARGLPTGATMYGWKTVGERGRKRIVEVPHEQTNINIMWDKRQQGWTLDQIAYFMNERAKKIPEDRRHEGLARGQGRDETGRVIQVLKEWTLKAVSNVLIKRQRQVDRRHAPSGQQEQRTEASA